MTYYAHALHQQGLKVLFYSGEMEANQVGYRYDSIDSQFSNRSLLFGRPLGADKSYAQYKMYLDKLSHTPNYFKVITPADLGGRFINMNDIHSLVEEYAPDVIFIDQLALVDDVRSTKVTQDRVKYGNIMADLRVLSSTKRIPIVVAAQANRMSATKDEEGEFTIPEISESDAIGHHCTRAIAFCTNKVDDGEKQIMKVAVRKNRHGGQVEFKLTVDFEHGIFDELKQKPLRSDIPEGAGKF
jgi:replicative DNA helicase